jgi:hypothetical protein
MSQYTQKLLGRHSYKDRVEKGRFLDGACDRKIGILNAQKSFHDQIFRPWHSHIRFSDQQDHHP